MRRWHYLSKSGVQARGFPVRAMSRDRKGYREGFAYFAGGAPRPATPSRPAQAMIRATILLAPTSSPQATSCRSYSLPARGAGMSDRDRFARRPVIRQPVASSHEVATSGSHQKAGMTVACIGANLTRCGGEGSGQGEEALQVARPPGSFNLDGNVVPSV
jgi:hypothetical protein